MSSDKAPIAAASASAAVATNALSGSSGSGGVAAANANAKLLHPGAEFSKGINGLDKVVLRDPRGSVAEVTPLLRRRTILYTTISVRFIILCD